MQYDHPSGNLTILCKWYNMVPSKPLKGGHFKQILKKLGARQLVSWKV